MPTDRVRNLVRPFTATGTRRWVLAGSAAALVAGLFRPVAHADEAAAPIGPEKKGKKRCQPACGVGEICKRGACVPNPNNGWTNQTVFGQRGSGNRDLDLPNAVEVVDDGLTAFVTDGGNNRVAVWVRSTATSTDWRSDTVFGTKGSGPWNFLSPASIKLTDGGLTAVIADTGNNRVSLWTRQDAASRVWQPQTTFGSDGSGDDQFRLPFGVALSADGLTAYVADSGNHRVSVWKRSAAGATDWAPLTRFGSQGSGLDQFNNPNDLAFDDTGLTLWIADLNNNRVSLWRRPDSDSTDWSNLTTFGSDGKKPNQLRNPDGVFVSADGTTVWVADRLNDRIAIWVQTTPNGVGWRVAALFGTSGRGPGGFDKPDGLWVAPNGRSVVVADRDNNRMSVWALFGPRQG